MRIVPWTVSAKGWAGRKPQDQVIAELMAEAPGILRWLVKGLKDWQADPSWVAERVTVATADYRQEQDRLARWLEEHCEVDKSHTESFKSLWQDYQAWCELNSIKPLGRGTFGSRLESAGHPPASGKGNKATREGLRLLSDIEREAKAKEAEAEAKKAAKEEADRKAREEAARRAAEDDSSDGNSDSGAGVNSVKSSPGNATRGDTRELQGQHLPHLTHETDNGDETPVDRNDPDTWPTCGVKGCGKRNPKVNADGQCPDCEGVGDKPPIARFNKQKSESIGWAKWSWNPVTGCKFGCAWCYAKDLTERQKGSFQPQFWPHRLAAPAKTPVPQDDDPGSRRVFVCSMGELFGDWVDSAWITRVLETVEAHPEWTFLMLTKNPTRYLDFSFPENVWLGATADTQARMDAALDVFEHLEAPVNFVSVEPLVEEPVRIRDGAKVDWVIIGGRSAANGLPAAQPPQDWVDAVTADARHVGAKVFHKKNLKVAGKLAEVPEVQP